MEQKNCESKLERCRRRVRDGYYLKENIYESIAERFLEELTLEEQKT